MYLHSDIMRELAELSNVPLRQIQLLFWDAKVKNYWKSDSDMRMEII